LSTILEHNREPEPGIPEAMPEGERLLWQGGASFQSLLNGSFHFRKLSLYFGIALLVQFVLKLRAGVEVSEAIAGTAGFLVLSLFALGVLSLYTWLLSRATLYTLTSKRVVIRTGVALPISVNLPYRRIQSADLRVRADGTGDFALLPEAGSRVSWLLLWPMINPWRVFRVRPVLRGVENAESVAEILAEQLAGAAVKNEVVREQPRTPAARSNEPRARWRPYPTIPLAAMTALVVIALVGVAWNVTEDTRVDALPDRVLTAEIELYFEDQEDGSVLVREARTGAVVDTLDPGTGGFLRATLRTLVRARGTVGAGAEEPFAIAQTEDGRILLIDPVSKREIDLKAFGPTNAQAFGRYLRLAERSATPLGDSGSGPKPIEEAAVGDETQVALTRKESTQ